jgi:serine/threonine-protein kinase
LGGRYQPEWLMGSGGMGAVWAGRDLRLDRAVAIKVLAGHGLTDPTALERFEREARIVARLTHPNVVAVHDFGAEDGAPYLVMELVEGESVSAMLKRGPLPVDRAVAIAAQACDGLAAAHAAGVVHRDVKPANLIVTPAGVVKICDFGIARLQDAAELSRLTGPAIAMGSSGYMSPEQVNGDPVDTRADLYGLGCTLYAMLTGGPPFTGDMPLEVAHQHLTRAPDPVAGRRPDVPPALAALVHRLLAKAPDDRPAGAVEVRDELTAIAGVTTVLTGPTADLRVTAIPQAAAVAGVTEVRPAASRPAGHGPEEHQPGGERPPTRSPARTWRRLALASAALAAVVALPVLAAAGCLPVASWVRPPAAAGPSQPAPPASSSSPSPATPVAAPSASNPAAPDPRSETRRPSPRVTVRPTATPSRSTVRAPAPPTDPIVGMRLSIQSQVAIGSLAPTTAMNLHKKVDEIAAKINKGDTKEAAKKVDELREELAKLLREGRLTPAGHAALSADLDRIDRSVS